jgi:uncharacterized protein
VTGGLFLDTAGWFAALSPRESGHAAAEQAYRDAIATGTRLLTTDLVVADMHALLLRWRDIATGTRFLDVVYRSAAHTVVHVDADLAGAALERWIRPFTDQRFSFCDAISFEVMRREGLKGALTFDRHFVVAGYQTLTG